MEWERFLKNLYVFSNIEAYKADSDRIELNDDGDDVVFTGVLVELYDPPFENVKRSHYDKRCD